MTEKQKLKAKRKRRAERRKAAHREVMRAVEAKRREQAVQVAVMLRSLPKYRKRRKIMLAFKKGGVPARLLQDAMANYEFKARSPIETSPES